MRSPGHRVPSRASWARLACAVSALALAATACSSGSASTLNPVFQKPHVGSCRVLAASDISASSNETPAVPCTKPHTAVTFAVGMFTAQQITSRALRSGEIGRLALSRCTTAWKTFVGGDKETQHISVAGLAYYLPDQKQLNKGARWYRCDLVLGGQGGMALENLPATVRGLLDAPLPLSLTSCRTETDFEHGHLVPCSQAHAMRAIGITPLPGGAAYPSTAALKQASAKGCTAVVKTWLHGHISGGAAYQWPDRLGWVTLHDHTATCWTVTTH